jgi:NitT/TauT family transport system permease protein
MRAGVIFRYAVVVAGIALVWKLAAGMIPSGVLPQPEDAVAAFFTAVQTASFWNNFQASLFRAVSAMVLSWCIAFPLGVGMGASRRLDAFLSPFVVLTYPIPKIVLLPILLLVLGLGDASKIGMITLILAYQVLVTTRDGVRGVHPKYIDSVRSLGAGKLLVFTEVLIPAALPHGFTALRLGTGVSVAVLFFVESFATRRGLGYLIMDAWSSFDFEGMFVGIFGMSLLGVLLYEIVNILERRTCKWKYSQTRSKGR